MATSKRTRYGQRRSPRKKKLTAKEKLQAYLAYLAAMPRKQKLSYLCGVLAAIALVVVVIVLLIPRPRALNEVTGGDYTDKKNGVTYTVAPMQYEPVAWKKTPYAKCGDLLFYPVSGLDPTRYLCTAEGGAAVLYCASDINLPEIDAFYPEQIVVCTDTETVMALSTVEKKEHARAVAEAFAAGKVLGETPEYNRILTLRFTSDAYPGLFYTLRYLEGKDSNYLYDRESHRCVDVGTLLSWYISRSDMPADSNSLIGEDAETTTKPSASDTAETVLGEETEN